MRAFRAIFVGLLVLGCASLAYGQIIDAIPRMKDKMASAMHDDLHRQAASKGLLRSVVGSAAWMVISTAWMLVDIVGLLFLFSLLKQRSTSGGVIFHNVVHRFNAIRARIEDAIFQDQSQVNAAPVEGEHENYLVKAVYWLLRSGAKYGFKGASKMMASSLLPLLYGLAFVWAMWDMVHQSGFKFSTLLLGLPVAWLFMPSRLFSVFTWLIWRAGDFGALLFAISFYKQA